MAIVTITTDLGVKDHYTAIVKGLILSKAPDVCIVDISHEVSPFNIQEAAFILRNAYTSFPPGTIHFAGVQTGKRTQLRGIALSAEGQYFVGLDNGLFSLVLDHDPDCIVELGESAMPSFPARDLLCDAIAQLAGGKPIEALGRKLNAMETRAYLRPPDNGQMMKGNVVYIDRFGNLIINITKARFEEQCRGRSFHIFYARSEALHEIKNTYSDVNEGMLLCLFNSSGYMEIAINQGNASRLLGLQYDDIIQIEFE